MYNLWPRQIPQGAIVAVTQHMAQGMGEMQVESEVGMQNLNTAKVGLEMTLVCFVFPTFSHVFSNAIQSHLVVQVTE
jgi:hypothetical protein